MVFFANPWLLLGLFFLAVPVLIHLFNKSRGKLVEIGHIELVRQAKKIAVTEIKINHWLLLFLRLMIIVLATLVIAEAYFEEKSTGEGDTAIVVTANWLILATEAEITELINREPKWLNLLSTDFKPLDKAVIKKLKAEQSEMVTEQNLWSLIAERLSQLASNDRLEIYSTNRQVFSQQVKPLISQQLTWHIKTITATSTKTALTNQADVPDFSVVIYHDNDRDLAYLQSSLMLIKEYQLPQLKLSLIKSENDRLPSADVIFYLSNKVFPPTLIKQIEAGTVVVKDVSDKQFTTDRLPILTQQSVLPNPALYQQAALGDGTLFQFYSRFEPQWSNSVLKAEFPAQVMLWLNAHQKSPAFRHVILAKKALILAKAKQPLLLPQKHLLFTWLMILLVIAWVCERWLSERLLRVIK